ncbi:MAG: hypothetical protein UV01_C0014G0002 [Parcubacteria group bacterium GW2011_GWA2_42_14]|nr:MAG: hypothetical protein UV01_C0014G0002 [Parcubacteria group bacterium GW2011_GWA2_42_14]
MLANPTGVSSFGSFGLPSFRSERDVETVDNVQVQQNQEGVLTQRKIIKNGSLSIFVKKVDEAVSNIHEIATRLSGFVASSQIYDSSGGVKSGSITVRVPASNFDSVLTEIKKIAVRVDKESVNAQDVTEQYIDLESQLRNLRAEEVQYLEIMKRAYTVQDTLNVAQRLSDVRGRIERIQGQLQYLSQQIDMSTISVTINADADIKIFGIQWRPIFVVKQSFRGMLEEITGYIDWMIWFIFSLPVIVLWVVTIVFVTAVVWRLFRWIKTRFFSDADLKETLKTKLW